MSKIKAEMTAQVLDQIAQVMIDTAGRLNKLAVEMRQKNDVSYATEAINHVISCFNNCRIDLLVARPIREYQKLEIRKAPGKN